MEKESNFRETWKMRIWMFLKMVNWICKKYCGFVAVTGCFFGTIELYVMTTDPILTTEVPVQISIAQKDYEMLLTGIFIIGATINHVGIPIRTDTISSEIIISIQQPPQIPICHNHSIIPL